MVDKRTQEEVEKSNRLEDPDERTTGDEPMTAASDRT
jgi:hypothetical protein